MRNSKYKINPLDYPTNSAKLKVSNEIKLNYPVITHAHANAPLTRTRMHARTHINEAISWWLSHTTTRLPDTTVEGQINTHSMLACVLACLLAPQSSAGASRNYGLPLLIKLHFILISLQTCRLSSLYLCLYNFPWCKKCLGLSIFHASVLVIISLFIIIIIILFCQFIHFSIV